MASDLEHLVVNFGFALRPAVSRYLTFSNSLLNTMLSGQKRKEQSFQKIQNFSFHNSFNNFGRDPPLDPYAWN